MDVYVLLDVLLIILIALFIPIGFWRGAYREAFVTLGILFGASLGRFWGEAWGIELAAVTRLHESGGAFMIAMLCLISATFLLGYSAGAALPVPDPGWVARLLGAFIAGANGALLLSFALRDIRAYLLSADEAGFLDNAVVAPFLSDGTGWILLVAAAVFVPIALVLAMFGPEYYDDDEYYEDDDYMEYEDEYPAPASYAPQRTMQLGQRRPTFAHQAAAASQSTPAPAEETRPVPTLQRAQEHSAGEAETRSGGVNADNDGTDESAEAVDTQRRVPHPEETRPLGAQGIQTIRSPQFAAFGAGSIEETTEERRIVFGHSPSGEADTEETETNLYQRCANCKEDVSNVEGFCPRCGEPIQA